MAKARTYILTTLFALTIVAVFAMLSSSFIFSGQITCKEIIANMNKGSEEVKTLKFTLRKKERINGKLLAGEQDCKFQRSPKKIYSKIIAPNKGVELLYVEGSNGNKALINPNGFPYMSLTFDPFSSTLRNNNHHTIHEVGFDYINSIVGHMAEKSGASFDKYFKYEKDTVLNGRNCYKVLIDYTPFTYQNYTVKANETVTDIAYRLFVSDYMILELNKEIDDYTDVKAGQTIRIPSAYARKTFLYIDKLNNLPILQVMYDDKSLFSSYEFINLQLNPAIPAEEFTKDYKDYDF